MYHTFPGKTLLISSSLKFNELNFEIIPVSSFHRRSAHDKVIKMLEHQAALPLLEPQKKFFFPVCWCTFDRRHETVSLILYYELMYSCHKVLTQHSRIYIIWYNFSHGNVDLVIQLGFLHYGMGKKYIIRVWSKLLRIV